MAQTGHFMNSQHTWLLQIAKRKANHYNNAVANPAQWKIVAPIMQVALECRQQINPDDPALRSLLPSNKVSQWALVPPKGLLSSS